MGQFGDRLMPKTLFCPSGGAPFFAHKKVPKMRPVIASLSAYFSHAR